MHAYGMYQSYEWQGRQNECFAQESVHEFWMTVVVDGEVD